MTFDELFDALRSLAEENAQNGFGNSAWNLYANIQLTNGTVGRWTLQPDQIETLVEGIIHLREIVDAKQAISIQGNTITVDIPGRAPLHIILPTHMKEV